MITYLRTYWDSLLKDESGQGTLEYSGLLVLAALLVFTAYQNLGNLQVGINGVINRALGYINSIT